MVEVGDPPLDDVGERTALGPGPGRQVLHQLGVEAAGLSAGPVQAPVGGDVGLGDDELPLQGDHACQVQEETLAGAELPDDEAHGRPAPLDPPEVVEHRGDLVAPPDLEVPQADPGHDAGAEGLEDGVALAGFDRTRAAS